MKPASNNRVKPLPEIDAQMIKNLDFLDSLRSSGYSIEMVSNPACPAALSAGFAFVKEVFCVYEAAVIAPLFHPHSFLP